MKNKTDPLDALGAAYEKMYERAAEDFNQLRKKSEPLFAKLVDEAKEKAIKLGELTEQEAEKIALWLKRDVDDASKYLTETGHELQEWLGYESSLLESAVLDLILRTADKTTLSLLQLKEQASHPYIYRAGEITGPGTLICSNCSENIQFYKTAAIPECPNCQGNEYHR